MQSSHHDSGFTVRLADPDAPQDAAGSAAGRSFAQRRRNRHGRGLRGELMLPTLPGYRTRSDRFDELVMDSAAAAPRHLGQAARRRAVCGR